MRFQDRTVLKLYHGYCSPCYPGLQWVGGATNKQKDRKIKKFVKEKDEFQFATRCLKASAIKEINIIKEKPSTLQKDPETGP